MAEEIKKTTTNTTRKKATPKPQEEPKPTPIEEQMAQMMAQQQQFMAMMMAQQQQLVELMAKTQQIEKQVVEVEEEVEVVEQPKKTKRVRQDKDSRRTKQDLRRDYKGKDIYLTNVSQGYVSYHGKNMTYEWKHNGDIEVVSIEDIINMPKAFLHTPWVCLDGYENEEDVINDIVEVLKLGHIYDYIYTLQDMEDNINEIDLDDVKRAIELSRKNGYDISMDLVILIDRKIREGVLTNYMVIGQLSELLGKKFM